MRARQMAVLSRSLSLLFLLVTFMFIAAAASLPTHAAPAAAPIVTTLDDEQDGSCSDGDCSLRDAINLVPEDTTITFGDVGTITLLEALGELVIDKNLTINGGGVITINGNEAVRIFNVSDVNVTFDGLTLTKGSAVADDCSDFPNVEAEESTTAVVP